MNKTYIVFHVASTMLFREFKRRADAIRVTNKQNKLFGEHTYSWGDREFYEKNVVHLVTRKNLMSGKLYTETSNTENFMSPASEAYWSM